MGRNADGFGRAPAEVRIAYEVAMSLKILPRFSDDGAPEGTVERSAAEVEIEPTGIGSVAERIEVRRAEEPEEEQEAELHLGEFL